MDRPIPLDAPRTRTRSVFLGTREARDRFFEEEMSFEEAKRRNAVAKKRDGNVKVMTAAANL